MVPPITPPDPHATHSASGDNATVHPIRKPPAPWLYEWGDARNRVHVAAVDAAKAIAQFDALDNEFIIRAHDDLLRDASFAFARQFGINMDLLPENRVVHLHRAGPATPPDGAA